MCVFFFILEELFFQSPFVLLCRYFHLHFLFAPQFQQTKIKWNENLVPYFFFCVPFFHRHFLIWSSNCSQMRKSNWLVPPLIPPSFLSFCTFFIRMCRVFILTFIQLCSFLPSFLYSNWLVAYSCIHMYFFHSSSLFKIQILNFNEMKKSNWVPPIPPLFISLCTFFIFSFIQFSCFFPSFLPL